MLHYSQVEEVISTADPEKGLPGPHGYGDLGYDEIERFQSGLLEHRMLFSSGIVLTVRHRGFSIDVHDRKNQEAEQDEEGNAEHR